MSIGIRENLLFAVALKENDVMKKQEDVIPRLVHLLHVEEQVSPTIRLVTRKRGHLPRKNRAAVRLTLEDDPPESCLINDTVHPPAIPRLFSPCYADTIMATAAVTTNVNSHTVIKPVSLAYYALNPNNQLEQQREHQPDSLLDDRPLFSASLISPEVFAALPADYIIRPICRSDYHRGYLDVLRVLTTVGDISEAQWNARYDWMASRNDEYYLLVVCDGSDRVVGTGSLIVERKFIHELGLVGHIEDIAVETGQQGKKLGLRIIQALDYVAANVGCYKSILDCSEVNEGFYVKCGFKRAGLEMAHYYNK